MTAEMNSTFPEVSSPLPYTISNLSRSNHVSCFPFFWSDQFETAATVWQQG